jgi:hypothetical protein
MRYFVVLLLIFALAPIARAETPQSTGSCHCFKDRAYNPDKKFAADKYLLTTSFNSFIAVNFNLSKSKIVMMKMRGGVDPDTLLIALYVAKEGGVDLDEVLTVLEHELSWGEIFASSSLNGNAKAKKVFAAIEATKGDDAVAAEIVTDQLLKNYFGMTDKAIASFRKEGITGRELVLVTILAGHNAHSSSAEDIIAMHGKQQKSWSEIAAVLGFTPKETGHLLKN